jgi:hypothetical protein
MEFVMKILNTTTAVLVLTSTALVLTVCSNTIAWVICLGGTNIPQVKPDTALVVVL